MKNIRQFFSPKNSTLIPNVFLLPGPKGNKGRRDRRSAYPKLNAGSIIFQAGSGFKHFLVDPKNCLQNVSVLKNLKKKLPIVKKNISSVKRP
jgi:hypothetical protein